VDLARQSVVGPRGVTQAMRKPKTPEANRARILRAALEEFAARGFKGASMDAIAARTHTTRALINYYFGGKEKVYLAVLEQVYADIRQAESRLDLDHLAPVDAIRRIVEFTYTYYLEHEGFVRLVVAENQAPSPFQSARRRCASRQELWFRRLMASSQCQVERNTEYSCSRPR